VYIHIASTISVQPLYTVYRALVSRSLLHLFFQCIIYWLFYLLVGVLHPIVRRRSSLFGHVARFPEDTPAHQALWCHIDLSLGRLPDPSWRRCPGRRRIRWLYQLHRDNSTPPADLWRWAVICGLSRVTLLSSLTDYMLATVNQWYPIIPLVGVH